MSDLWREENDAYYLEMIRKDFGNDSAEVATSINKLVDQYGYFTVLRICGAYIGVLGILTGNQNFIGLQVGLRILLEGIDPNLGKKETENV